MSAEISSLTQRSNVEDVNWFGVISPRLSLVAPFHPDSVCLSWTQAPLKASSILSDHSWISLWTFTLCTRGIIMLSEGFHQTVAIKFQKDCCCLNISETASFHNKTKHFDISIRAQIFPLTLLMVPQFPSASLCQHTQCQDLKQYFFIANILA